MSACFFEESSCVRVPWDLIRQWQGHDPTSRLIGKPSCPLRKRMPVAGSILLIPWCCLLGVASAFGIPGIWKLCLSDYALHQIFTGAQRDVDIFRAKLMKLQNGKTPEVLVKLNPDGSFRQCSEYYQEGRWFGGRWRLRNDEGVIVLALDRQYYGPRFDILLIGELSQTARIGGNVYQGKFMYPKKHPAFFDGCLTHSMNTTGTFQLERCIATESILTHFTAEDGPEPRFRVSDFVNRAFLLCVEPIESRITIAATKDYSASQPFDLRTMRVQFHGNSTFQAFAPDKILRGRYSVKHNTEGEFLQFQVSLFGAGRSAPGSVYSEGKSLSHDDKRYYSGVILQDAAQRFIVQGTVFFGTDLGRDARPEPVGKFQLIESSDSHGELSYLD